MLVSREPHGSTERHGLELQARNVVLDGHARVEAQPMDEGVAQPMTWIVRKHLRLREVTERRVDGEGRDVHDIPKHGCLFKS